MFFKLLLVFILIPFIELAILIKIGTLIGFWPTILIVAITGVVGAFLARNQGFSILARIKSELNSGIMPAESLIDGFLVLIGGVVLLTPGLLTDLCGLLMLIPFSRDKAKLYLRKKIEQKITTDHTKTTIIIE